MVEQPRLLIKSTQIDTNITEEQVDDCLETGDHRDGNKGSDREQVDGVDPVE